MSKKDWRRQLLRVKQIADQNFGRAEKTEALSEDLQNLEKQVEIIRLVWHQTGKKLMACMPSKKKLPETALSAGMLESAQMLQSTESLMLLGPMFSLCGNAQSDLSNEAKKLDAAMETIVIEPITHLLEEDIPSIQKHRKHLNKLVLDMDSARSRYAALQKERATGGPANKLDQMKEELEDAQTKVDYCRDQLATEMFTFVSKESSYSELLVGLVEAQAEYHKTALQTLENILPQMNQLIEQHSQVPVYGTSLEEHLRRTNRDIAVVLEDCIFTIMQLGMEEEGIFRIAGSASKVKKLKAAFDSGCLSMDEFTRDIHCVAGAMKLYLRELPEPLMTFDLYQEWMDAAHYPADQRLQQLWLVLDKLKNTLPEYYNNLRYLIKFLAKLSEQSEINKMTPSNIAIVIGPNLIWSRDADGPSVLTTSTLSVIVEAMVTHADWFFPGEIDFSGGSERDTPPGTLSSPPHGLNNTTDTSPHAASGSGRASAQALFNATAPAVSLVTGMVAPQPVTASGSAQALFQATSPARMSQASSNSTLPVSTVDCPTTSPRTLRKGKKPAPLPPAVPERPTIAPPPTPQQTTVSDNKGMGSEKKTSQTDLQSNTEGQISSLSQTERPDSVFMTDEDSKDVIDTPLQIQVTSDSGDGSNLNTKKERPHAAPPARPVSPNPSSHKPSVAEKPLSPRHDRPSEPPPPRPTDRLSSSGGTLERPKKPEKPSRPNHNSLDRNIPPPADSNPGSLERVVTPPISANTIEKNASSGSLEKIGQEQSAQTKLYPDLSGVKEAIAKETGPTSGGKDAHPVKPPSRPPAPPRRGHSSRSDMSSDKSREVQLDAPVTRERLESKGAQSSPSVIEKTYL